MKPPHPATGRGSEYGGESRGCSELRADALSANLPNAEVRLKLPQRGRLARIPLDLIGECASGCKQRISGVRRLSRRTALCGLRRRLRLSGYRRHLRNALRGAQCLHAPQHERGYRADCNDQQNPDRQQAGTHQVRQCIRQNQGGDHSGYVSADAECAECVDIERSRNARRCELTESDCAR